jgi:hypothetical protein
MLNWTYLGDGVYARFDGYQVWISIKPSTDPRQAFNNAIALEPTVLEALIEFNRKQRVKTEEGIKG